LTPPVRLVSRSPSPSLVALLAVGAGLSVASLYYNQPMLGRLAASLGATPGRIGAIPVATQLGYAAGIILFGPLGDKLDRRKVIVVKAGLLVLALVLAGLARDVLWLSAASLAVGLAATVAQDLVPAAAAIADPASRGKTVGTVMTGLLLGILLSRVVSGAVTEYLSWRAVFLGAAGIVALFAVTAAQVLPSFPPTARASYVALLASMGALVRDVAPLRRAAVTQGLLSFAFSGFWSTLALGLAAPPFGLSSVVAGSFGIAGAAGAMAAPIAGGLSDRRGPAVVIRAGAALTVGAFVAMALLGRSLAVLVIGTVVFDLGVQSCLIAHQTIVYAQDPAARSRLNAVLVSAMFLGMSGGAFVASRVFLRSGLSGVCAIGALAAGAALALRMRPEPAR
jgi:predicted MFS family arabinose efflux permease